MIELYLIWVQALTPGTINLHMIENIEAELSAAYYFDR